MERASESRVAEREAEKARRELEGCTFTPALEGGAAGERATPSGEVHERLFREASMHDAGRKRAQEDAVSGVRRLSTVAVDPVARDALLLEEQRRSKSGLKPAPSSLSMSAAATAAASLRVSISSSSMRGGAGTLPRSTSRDILSPAVVVAHENDLTFAEEPPIAVRSVAVVPEGGDAAPPAAGAAAARDPAPAALAIPAAPVAADSAVSYATDAHVIPDTPSGFL